MAVRAVIFDVDGLTLDTETPEFVAGQEASTANGATLELGIDACEAVAVEDPRTASPPPRQPACSSWRCPTA